MYEPKSTEPVQQPRRVNSRFTLRAPQKHRPLAKDASIFSYAQAGRASSGESGRMGQGGSSF